MDILKLRIEQAEYSLGQIAVPQNFTNPAIKDGKMITQEVSISGRKFPLEDIRKNLLIRHTKYMRLTTDEEFSNMELSEVQQKLTNLREFSDNDETLEELLIKLQKMERTRYFAFWHDGSTIGNHSHLLITVNVLYDPAFFLSDEEYYLKYKKI